MTKSGFAKAFEQLDQIVDLKMSNDRMLAVLKQIAEEPDGDWKTVLAWRTYKAERA